MEGHTGYVRPASRGAHLRRKKNVHEEKNTKLYVLLTVANRIGSLQVA